MKREKCYTCKYWDQYDREHVVKDAHPDDQIGVCKRYPPVRDMDWSFHNEDNFIEDSCEDWRAWQQPCTQGCCWCGEYRERKQ